jgi:arylsulfatase A-like enzyme
MARAGALVAVLLAGCTTDCTPRGDAARPNVILITVDTLRADHLGCYGSPAVKTPHLDRLAAEGTLFERAYAQSHITVPSHLTILSGLPMAEHGVGDNGARTPRRIDVLPELFARAGYRTAAFVSAKHLGPEWTLAPLLPSLEAYHAPRRMSVGLRGEETNRALFGWLRGACRDPFFAWVHYWDPHMPYEPPPEFARAYYDADPHHTPENTMGGVRLNWYFFELGDLRRRLMRQSRGMRVLKREHGLSNRQLRQLVLYPTGLGALAGTPEAEARLRARLRELADGVRDGLPLRKHFAAFLTGVRDLRYPIAQYAAEVAYTDAQIGRVRAALERLRLHGRTLLIVTADHGEGLGEHGIYFNHFGLHENTLHVPLIVWGPGRVPPTRTAAIAAGTDVAPTVLRLAGLPVPGGMRGRDLFAPHPPEPLVAESMRQWQVMLRDGRWKLIRTRESFFYVDAFAREAGAQELYDLDADPRESTNLAAAEPATVAALSARMDAWLATHRSAPQAEVAPVSPEKLEQLRALGYAE